MAGSACTSACVACVTFHAGMLGLSERCECDSECLACQCSTFAPCMSVQHCEMLAVCYFEHVSASHATPDCALSHDHPIAPIHV